MASEIRKFINPKFLRTIDLALMRDLFARHFSEAELPFPFDGEIAEVRAALTAYFDGPVTDWSEGLVADLHRVAELGTSEGMQIILNDARRQGVTLFPEPNPETRRFGTAPARPQTCRALHLSAPSSHFFRGRRISRRCARPQRWQSSVGPSATSRQTCWRQPQRRSDRPLSPLFAQDLQGG